MKKRVLAALFAGVMAISFCACGSDAGSTDSDTMTDTQQQHHVQYLSTTDSP